MPSTRKHKENPMNRALLQLLSIQFILLGFCEAGITKRTSITLGTENWPPYSYRTKQSNLITGLSTEIIEEVFKQMNVSIKSNILYPWIRAQKAVFKGSLDAVYTASINEERKKNCYFPAEPLVTSKWVLFIKDSNKLKHPFTKLTDLNKKRIGLIRGYNYPKKFNNYIRKNSLIEEVSYEDRNIAKLMLNRIDYMPAVLETTLYLARNNQNLRKIDSYKDLYYYPSPLATSNFYLMFSKKKVTKQFVERFSNELRKFKKTITYREILKKYILK